MPRTKRAREEGDGVELRTGITWKDPNYVVEMRLAKTVAESSKLWCGSYLTVQEANVARDYAAYLRNSTGEEDCAMVGGFRDPGVHPSIYEFEESREVFESLEGSRAQARCDEYKRLLPRPPADAWKNFCQAAREDIRVAIESFRSRDPRKFPPRPSNHVPNAEPVYDEIHLTPPPSNSEIRVSPTPGREVGASMGEGSIFFSNESSLEVIITVNGYPFQVLLFPNAPPLLADEILTITKAGIEPMERVGRELIDKLLEDLDPCPIDPRTIPVLQSASAEDEEVPNSPTSAYYT